MGLKRSNAVVFKPYSQNQTNLFPTSLDELIAENHPVRVVNRVLDTIDLEPIRRLYKGGGTSAYHPRLLLKILVYGYLTNTYSSRKLEEQVRQNIHFMWLAGMKTPDHHTINRFRGEKLSGQLKPIFGQIVELLIAERLVSLKEAVFVDGTKIESAANRYTFVWGKAIQTSKERIQKQLDELWRYAQQVAADEKQEIGEVIFTPISKEKVEHVIQQIDEVLADKKIPQKVRQKIQYARKNWPANLDKYEAQEGILKGRNSFSKTDPDATFMRMKDDHMRNGQLKPAYNLQISTQDQFILNYSLHQNPTDTLTLKPHVEKFAELYSQLPTTIVADAGYGSSENYAFLDEAKINAYVKDFYFDRDQRKRGKKKNPYTAENFKYVSDSQTVHCPSGLQMKFFGNRKTKTTTGFTRTISQYQATECANCPFKQLCCPDKPNRFIEIDLNLRRYRENARSLLTSDKGIKYRKQRCFDVEPVFANIKNNHSFKRFLMRSITKTEVEIGLLSIAQNLRKWKA